MWLFNILLAVSLLCGGGCAYYVIELPVASVDERVKPTKDNRVERLRAGNVLLVNRSPVWREVLVFDGYRTREDLITFGPDGLPVLAVEPMGHLEIGPADDDSSPRYGEKLVSFERPGQSYTLFIVSKGMAGQMIGPPQIFHDRVSETPMGEMYHHYQWLGVNGGQMVREPVNDVVYLPERNPRQYGMSNTLEAEIDINMLLRRGLYHLTNP